MHSRSGYMAEREDNPKLPDDWDDETDTMSSHRPTERMALLNLERRLSSRD